MKICTSSKSYGSFSFYEQSLGRVLTYHYDILTCWRKIIKYSRFCSTKHYWKTSQQVTTIHSLNTSMNYDMILNSLCIVQCRETTNVFKYSYCLTISLFPLRFLSFSTGLRIVSATIERETKLTSSNWHYFSIFLKEKTLRKANKKYNNRRLTIT